MKHIATLITILFMSLLSSPSWSEQFTSAWVQENSITLNKLMDISNQSDADGKFKISRLLEVSSWAFETDSEFAIDATRSVILHEAAGMGHAKAQFTLSHDYQQGINGFEQNQRLAELWLKKAILNGIQTDEYHSNLDRFKNPRAYGCSIDLETVTGLSRTETKKPDWEFGILFEYGDFVMFFLDDRPRQQFECSKTTLLSVIGPYLQKQCTAEVTDRLAEYFLTADDRSGNKVGSSTNIPYSWVVGLPDLVTIRQGNCRFLSDVNFE